ncbi:hypothetical protein ABK040_010823 [Willaertia magna]
MNHIREFFVQKTPQRQYLLLYKIFKAYDTDNNNQIDSAECVPFFLDFLKELGMQVQQITDKDVKSFLEGIDTDGSGTISFFEFEKWFKENVVEILRDDEKKKTTLLDKYLQEKDSKKKFNHLKQIFDKYDTNKDNKIDINEFSYFLKDLMRTFGIENEITNDHIAYFFQNIDTDNSGDISLNEFDQWLTNNIDKFQ